MTNTIIFILGWIVGGLFGFIAAALLSASKNDDYSYLNHDQNDEFTSEL